MATAPRAQVTGADPVKVDPRHYTVEFENERVRVIRVHFGPREKSVMHAHPPGVSMSLTDRDMKYTLPDGRTRNIMGRAGDIVWYDGHEHLPENLSSQSYEGIHIELKE